MWVKSPNDVRKKIEKTVINNHTITQKRNTNNSLHNTNIQPFILLCLEEDEEEPGTRKSGIPQPIHKVLMAKFAAGSGSGSGSESSELDESSASDDDISEASGSGEMGSGSQKKDEVQTGVAAASGSGEATVSHTSSPTPGAAEIGSGSGSHLAEGIKHNYRLYYIHPCNVIGSHQCDLFTNPNIFCSKSHLF